MRADVGWIKGNFNWKFGLDHRWMRTTGEKLPTGGFDDAGVQGVFEFSNAQTALASNATGRATRSPATCSVWWTPRRAHSTRTHRPPNSATTRAYAQTDWRVRPNLTLNFGFRYEIPIPRSTDPTAFTSFDPNLTDPRSGLKGALAYLGDCAGCIDSERFGDIDYSSIGPRLGLAWSMDQKTVLRLGYGIYYAAGNGLTGGFCLRCQNGYSNTAGCLDLRLPARRCSGTTDLSPPANFLAPPIISPSAGNAADDVWYIAPNSGTAPRFQNWSLSIQRELPWKFIAEVAYIGNRGTRLSATASTAQPS